MKITDTKTKYKFQTDRNLPLSYWKLYTDMAHYIKMYYYKHIFFFYMFKISAHLDLQLLWLHVTRQKRPHNHPICENSQGQKIHFNRLWGLGYTEMLCVRIPALLHSNSLYPIFETSAFKCFIRVMWFCFPVSFLYSHILQVNCILSLTKDAAHHFLPTWGFSPRPSKGATFSTLTQRGHKAAQ